MEYREISSNELIVYDVELSDFLYRKNRVLKLQHSEPLLTEQDLTIIYDALLKANITDPKARELHKQALQNNPKEERPNIRATCTIFKKQVSNKVKTYCLSNKKFNGKIYCFEHQKSV